MTKKYMALLFYLSLVAILFYFGINLAEQGSKNLLGVEEPPRAFRILMPAEAGGDVEIFWSGNSKSINIAFISGIAGEIKNRMQSVREGGLPWGLQNKKREDP